MPPSPRSRYLGVIAVKNEVGKFFMSERKPFPYDSTLSGTRLHTVSDGDKLWNLAYQYFRPMKNAEHLWWVIAEFQPTPIKDLTLDLPVGSVLYIPSVRVVQERIMGH